MPFLLDRVDCCRGMLEKGLEPQALPMQTWHGDAIPEAVAAAIQRENLFVLGGKFGDKGASLPVQYVF